MAAPGLTAAARSQDENAACQGAKRIDPDVVGKTVDSVAALMRDGVAGCGGRAPIRWCSSATWAHGMGVPSLGRSFGGCTHWTNGPATAQSRRVSGGRQTAAGQQRVGRTLALDAHYGGTVTVSGVVRRAGTTPIPGRTVTPLCGRRHGASTWKTLASRTSSSGAVLRSPLSLRRTPTVRCASPGLIASSG